jgi:type I restriction enzyme, S subunit
MEGLLEKISEELKIDKSQWTPTKFGDVAIQQKGKVDRDNTDLTRYVQGGHMNSEDLHLRSWGELKDEYLGPAFIRRFDEGDILYGSRRTYLRKVVIAPFSGITSNTTFVIRANEKNIDKRLLPFIMMSEGFTENSVRNSKGSVNPYINWKDIAKYEFLLPPKDQQAQLAKLLWAMDDVIEKEKGLKNQLEITYHSNKKEIYNSSNNIKINLGEHIDILSGFAFKSKYFNKESSGIPLIRIRDIENCSVETFYSSEYDSRYIIKEGDMIVGMDGDFIINIWNGPEALLNQRVLKIETVDDKNQGLFKYLKHFLQRELDRIHRGIGATTVKHLAVSDLKKTKLPIPSNGIEKVNKKLDKIVGNINNSSVKIINSQSLQKSLINQIF